jgi:RNA:NAD 2'-phosphotransferase (TPT1/KptA family)
LGRRQPTYEHETIIKSILGAEVQLFKGRYRKKQCSKGLSSVLGTKTEMLRKKLEEQGTTQTKRSRKVVKHKQAHKQKQHSLKILQFAPRVNSATTKKRSDVTF